MVATHRFLFSPQTLGFHDPIWRGHIFQMAWNQPPTRYTWESKTAMHAAQPHSQWLLHPATVACFRQKAPKELWDNSPKFERMARKRACARNLILRVIGMRWYWRPLKIFSCNDADDALIFVVWSLFLSDFASFTALTCYNHSCVFFCMPFIQLEEMLTLAFSLPSLKLNIYPENRPSQKEVVAQTPFFRGKLLVFRECI